VPVEGQVTDRRADASATVVEGRARVKPVATTTVTQARPSARRTMIAMKIVMALSGLLFVFYVEAGQPVAVGFALPPLAILFGIVKK
jgi:hypothetical protein